MSTEKKELVINDITKWLILENSKSIKSFIRNFKGGVGDEEDFAELTEKIDMNRLGIPDEIQLKFDTFIDCELSPMVYDVETEFPVHMSIIENKEQNEEGAYVLDSEDELKEMLVEYFEVMFEKEKAWDAFAERELKPYILN